MKLVFVASFLFMSTLSFADQMTFVGYSETNDCSYPSSYICHPDEHNINHCIIKLNEQCA